jgi:hypothetical protein
MQGGTSCSAPLLLPPHAQLPARFVLLHNSYQDRTMGRLCCGPHHMYHSLSQILIVSEKGGRCKLQVDISATITVASPTMRQHPYTCIVPAMIIMQCWRGSLLFYAVLTSACTLGSLRLEYTPPACSIEYPRPCPLSLIPKPNSCLPP